MENARQMRMQVKWCFERSGQTVIRSMVMCQAGEQKALGPALPGVVSVEIMFEVEIATRIASLYMS